MYKQSTVPCRYSIPPSWGFYYIKSKHTLYCGKDCMKKFCESLKEHAARIIEF